MASLPVKKDHYIYCPGGDCTCPPIPQSQKIDVRKVLKSLDSMNKAKPCPVTMPVVKPKPKVEIPKITKKVIDPEVTYNKEHNTLHLRTRRRYGRVRGLLGPDEI